MLQATLLPDLITLAAQQRPQAVALSLGKSHLNYAALHEAVSQMAAGLLQLGVGRAERVGIYLEKRFEAVVASFAAPLAGAVFVPINPLLKAEQVAHILRDCNVRVLVTSPERLALLAPVLATCPDLQHLVLCVPNDHGRGAIPDDASGLSLRPRIGSGVSAPAIHDPKWDGSRIASGMTAQFFHVNTDVAEAPTVPEATHVVTTLWPDLLNCAPKPGHRVIDTDLAAILYTSGSTGQPKGVMLSHRNLVAGANSVASYLENQPDDVLLAALPLSFDAGFSQLTTAFRVGARVVLLNYLLPRDVLKALDSEKVTGLTAVPPLYLQLINVEWPEGAGRSLRYWANTGGHMPPTALAQLRQKLPQAKPFLMYGLTEAFRSTYLPPHEVDRRPNSIGQAIPNAEVLVLRPDGTHCATDEAGELVHRGPLVALGYWNDAAQTLERFKVLPTGTYGRPAGLQLPEVAVFSGDTVRQDAEGFLYFVGRRDEMIKTSGYRVSPTEVEDILYATGLVNECVAFGVPHEQLGQTIQIIATSALSIRARGLKDLINECKSKMPAYMVPNSVEWVSGPLPRNANGKIDRTALASTWLARHTSAPS